MVDDNLSYRLLLRHLDLFLVVILNSPVLAITHHYVEIGKVFIVNYSNHLVVVVQFMFRWVLVVLDTAYFIWLYMCGKSRFEF